MSEILLSICIPTFNREKQLRECLNHLLDEYDSDLFNDVEIIISDNCSNDDTQQVIEYFKTKLPLICRRQSSNIGLAKNVKALCDVAKGTYIWYISDDDKLRKNLVRDVILLLRCNHGIGSIFINYRTITGGIWYKGAGGKVSDSKDFVVKNFDKLRGGFMLLSANVSSTHTVKELLNNIDMNVSFALALPLAFPLMSLNCGELYILNGENIINNDVEASWTEQKDDLAVRYRFECIKLLNGFGYSENQIKEMCIRLFVKEKFKVSKALNNIKKYDSRKYEDDASYLNSLLGRTFSIYKNIYIFIPIRELMKKMYRILCTR